MGFRLRGLPAGLRLAITVFVMALGLGYTFALLNIYVHYSRADGDAGLSAQDIIVTFHGSDQQSLLEAKILTGSMRDFVPDSVPALEKKENLPPQGAALYRGKIVSWVKNGASQEEYNNVIAPILQEGCVGCHGPRGIMASFPLTTYEEVRVFVNVNRGKSLSSLVQSSHTHLIAMSMMFFLLAVLFCLTGAPNWLKSLVVPLPFVGVIFDVGGWWLTKVAPFFAYPMMAAGALMGTGFAVFSFGILGECWLAKPPPTTRSQISQEYPRARSAP